MNTLQKRALKYALLPGFIPRIRDLFSSGFGHVAYLIALVYSTVRLLPPNHPYLNPANRGRFGIRHVVAEAANNLVFSKKNIDQIILFFTVLCGIILLFIQTILLGVSLVAEQPVFAAAGGGTVSAAAGDESGDEEVDFSFHNIFFVTSEFGHGNEYYKNTNGESSPGWHQDLVFIMLDRIFGLKNIYNSCISTDVDCHDLNGDVVDKFPTYPTNFHLGLHKMLEFYAKGIFIVGIFLITYYVITLVGETAVSGTPFGQRMNKTWAPIRLIFFLAIITPVSIIDPGTLSDKEQESYSTVTIYGNPQLSGSQYITFWAAKVGSNLGTNGWGFFAKYVLRKEPEKLIASPETPDYAQIVDFIFVAKTCQILEQKMAAGNYSQYGWKASGKELDFFLVRPKPAESTDGYTLDDYASFTMTDFNDAIEFSQNGNMLISVGYHDDTDEAKKYPGQIIPQCGQITIPIIDKSQAYLRVMQALHSTIHWLITHDTLIQYAACLTERSLPQDNNTTCDRVPDGEFARLMIQEAQTELDERIQIAKQYITDNKLLNEGNDEDGSIYGDLNKLIATGWGGAGLWYNRIAEINGKMNDGIHSIPKVIYWPMVMETVKSARFKVSADYTEGVESWLPNLPKGEKIRYDRPDIDKDIAPVLYEAKKVFAATSGYNHTPSSNMFENIIETILGAGGVYDMRRNLDAHPMAQLSSLGKSMMTASLRNVFSGFGAAIVGLTAEKGSTLQKSASTAENFFLTVGMATLALSFMLYYVLPFLPFVYFMFAVSGWIKSIFEATVAMPLWALAHIRIDGEGLPGSDAANGYYLLLEIVIRPILIVIGMLASLSMFNAMVSVLNEIFNNVIDQVGGGSQITENSDGHIINVMRGPIDDFFITCMYVIITYMIGLSCFKLVDLIPNQIMRWSGQNVATFQESAGDPAGEISQRTFSGTTMLTQKLSGGQLAALLQG